MPIWVTSFFFFANSASVRASQTVWVSGFSQYACRPLRERHVRDVEMAMIGRRTDDRVEPLGVDHLAEVGKELRLGELGPGLAGHALIDVAQGDDISVGLAGQLTPVVCPLVADADDAHADPLARRGAANECRCNGRGRGGHEEVTASEA